MKQVIAIVKPYLVEKVLDALKLAPVEACGVCEVKGYGRQKSYLDEYRGSEYSMAYLPKVEITLWVDDLRVEEVVRTIVEPRASARPRTGARTPARTAARCSRALTHCRRPRG